MGMVTPIFAGAAIAPRGVVELMRPGVLNLAQLPPLALYVHLPWCLRKCPYCDFNSHALGGAGGPDAVPEDDYLQALRADLEAALPLIWGRPVISIFLGGGTPSLFSPAAIDRLLSDLRALLPLAADCEITLEANPGTFERERFAAFRAAGVTRISIGVQSFDDACLQRLGRVHDGGQAAAALAAAGQLFDEVNCDLMYALPGQDLAALERDVEQALALAPVHLSLYELTIEPNTLFALHPPPRPGDDEAAQMQAWLERRLGDAGYEHYEISAHAKPGHFCRHNLNYWEFGDYLGIGAGAHSKLSFAHRIVRQVRFRQPARYMAAACAGAAIAEDRDVPRADLPFEFMLNALRLCAGVPAALYAARTGMPPSSIERPIEALVRRGLLSLEHDRLQPTELGRRFLNDLQAAFLPDAG
jgi:putative oxygen-independent coproporphyrinogen III oxidase